MATKDLNCHGRTYSIASIGVYEKKTKMNTNVERGEILRKERKEKVVHGFPVTKLDGCRSQTQLAFVREVCNYSQGCYNKWNNMICNQIEKRLKLKRGAKISYRL